MPFFRRTDKKNMADFHSLNLLEALDHQFSAFDDLILDGPIDDFAKRIVAENANDYGGVGIRKGFGRPLYELHKIVQKDRLELILTSRRGFRMSVRCDTRHDTHYNHGD